MLKSGPTKIAIFYVIISLLWGFGIDHLLYSYKNELGPTAFSIIYSSKRLFFTFVSGIMLYLLIKRVNDRILEHTNEYSRLYYANPSPMWIYDPETLKFISVNDMATDIYGYSREEFLNMTIKDIRPEEDHERLMHVVTRDGNFQKSGIWQHIKKDGTLFHVDVSSHMVKFKEREAVLVLARDYSETLVQQQQLTQVNQDLANEKKRLSDIQKLSKIAGWDFYIEDRKLVMSDEMYKIFGIDRNLIDFDYHLFFKVVHRDDLHSFISAFTDTMEKGTDLDIVHRLFLGKEHVRYIRELGQLEYRDGKPFKIRGTLQDITELKQMELERVQITNENRRLDNIITKINNMVILIDTQSRITWVNTAYEQFSGYKLDEIAGHRPSEIMTDLTDKAKVAAIDKAQERMESFSIDVILFKKNKERYWVNIEFTPMFENGKYIGYITVHNDITARKEKESEITKQNTTLRNVAWLSSHEIRRPAASIMALIDLIKTTKNAKDKDELLTLLDESTHQLDAIIRLINITIYKELPEVEQEN